MHAYHNANVETLESRYVRLDWGERGVLEAAARRAQVQAVRSFARMLGIENIEIKIRRLKKERPELSDEEAVGHIVRSELGIKPLEVSTAKREESKHNCNESTNCSPYGAKIVEDEKDLIQHLNEGWDLVKEISGGRFIIRKRNCGEIHIEHLKT